MQVNRFGNRQRFLAALEHRFTAEVPFFEFDVAENIVSEVMGRPFGVCMLKLPARDHVEFLQRTGMDVGYLAEGWRLGRRNFVDDRSRVHYVDGTIKTPSDVSQIRRPALDPVRRRIESFLAAADHTDLGCVFALDVAPKLANMAIGPTDFLIALYDDPNFVNELMDRIEEYTLPLAECVAEYPIDACFVNGPLCATSGPIVSPPMHDEFIFPRIQKVLSILKQAKKPIILHSDGDNSFFMDWIVQMEFAGLHPIQPGSGEWNIYDLKQRYGDRICLIGNIDVAGALTFGSPDDVRSDTMAHLRELAPGGGYICGSSHDITDGIPTENFFALAETVCSYRHMA